MSLRLIFLFASIIFYLNNINAQTSSSLFYRDISIHPSDSNNLFFGIRNTNFLKNNEYFNQIVDGYTLLGYFIRPSFIYFPSTKTRIEAGVHLGKYSGIEKFTDVVPVFSVHHKFNHRFQLVIGSLYGTVHHRLIEPLFQSERYFTNNVENGLQFLFITDNFNSDLWINWEQFVFQGDPFREKFTFGSSSELKITDQQSPIFVSIPMQLVAVHKGGQINESQANMENLINAGTGIRLTRYFSSKPANYISLDNYFVYFHDISPTKSYIYDEGFGVFPNFNLKIKDLLFNIGYWYSEKYYAPRGEPMFFNISVRTPGFGYRTKSMITSHVAWENKLFLDMKIGLSWHSYFDLIYSDFDFGFGFYLVFNRDFFIKNIKPYTKQ